MANTAGFVYACKVELLLGTHNFSSDAFKGALYGVGATISPSTSAYTSSGEQGNTGSYVAGGIAIPNQRAPALGANNQTAIWTPYSGNLPTSLDWTGVTFASPGVDCLYLYNAQSGKGNKGIAVFNFLAQIINASNFSLGMPTHDVNYALLRVN